MNEILYKHNHVSLHTAQLAVAVGRLAFILFHLLLAILLLPTNLLTTLKTIQIPCVMLENGTLLLHLSVVANPLTAFIVLCFVQQQ